MGSLAWLNAVGHSFGGAGPRETPRNIVLLLSDDHRYDFMGFMDRAPGFLETPNLDRMAREGAHLVNAFVSTSLCSPSRASILTGQYMHHHGIVDNQRRNRRDGVSPICASGLPDRLHRQMARAQRRSPARLRSWESFKGQGYFNRN